MRLAAKDRIFDTIVDTNKLYVSMNTYFTIRKYKHKPQLAYVYLFATGNKQRERINIDLEIAAADWDKKARKLIENSKENQDKNLILDNYISKVTNIKTEFRLSDKPITPVLLRRELLNGMVRVNFVSFFKFALEEDRVNIEPSTFERYESVYKKLYEYNPEIIFAELELKFFNNIYRTYLAKVKKNGSVTINSNLIVLKKYLKKAVKYGIKIKFDPDEVLGGSTKGNRTYLTPTELKVLLQYYTSPFINSAYKLILGYFLFDCMTGMRISDLMKIERKELANKSISFINKKSKADQTLSLNKKAQWIVEECPDLFIVKFSEKHMNEEIKKIMRSCNIDKKVFFHVGRHTFATCFLRAGGSVQHLQKLLKHKNINDTMIYVHILEEEANEHIYLIDKLFD
jgi:integrase/recombinase XerD